MSGGRTYDNNHDNDPLTPPLRPLTSPLSSASPSRGSIMMMQIIRDGMQQMNLSGCCIQDHPVKYEAIKKLKLKILKTRSVSEREIFCKKLISKYRQLIDIMYSSSQRITTTRSPWKGISKCLHLYFSNIISRGVLIDLKGIYAFKIKQNKIK